MKLFTVTRVVALVSLTAMVSSATVIYQFAGFTTALGPQLVQVFQLTVPDFLQPPPESFLHFDCKQLDFSLRCGLGVFFSAADDLEGFSFSDANNTSYGYSFLVGTLGKPGVHQTINYGDPDLNNGTLKVIVAVGGPVSPVPEPSSLTLALLATAIFGMTSKKLSSRWSQRMLMTR